MSRYFYRLRMCRLRRGIGARQQARDAAKNTVQYNLMQLGNELVCSHLAFGAPGQPLERGSKEIETVTCALEAGPFTTEERRRLIIVPARSSCKRAR